MNERRPVSSFETSPHRQVSADERNALKRDALLEKISLRAEEVRDQLIASKYKPEATIGIVVDVYPENVIEPRNCWIVTNIPSIHHQLGKMVVEGSAPRNLTTGYALLETGKIVEYETDQDIRNKPELLRVLGKHFGEIITKNPIDSEEYIDNGIMPGLNKLSERAKIVTGK